MSGSGLQASREKASSLPYPHIIETKPAAVFMKESFGEFKQFLETFVKRSITDEDIERAIKVYNHTRRLLKQLWEFLRRESPPITGPEVATVTLASQFMDKQECNQLLEPASPEIGSRAGHKAVRTETDGIGRSL